ncbi:MAG: helicase [Alphaproteobacteria bacterium]|nr:helicase [Alphaproteobacteria bacterium]
MKDYQSFIASKKPRPVAVGIDPPALNSGLFDFQAACVDFALRQGRCGLYLDTGLGKTYCQLEWADKAMRASNGRALILTPLAVARQIEREAHARGYDARVIRDQSEARTGINIVNYDRLDKIDPAAFGAVSLDEASILKSFTGSTTRALIAAFAGHRFKMAATATPAPNDHMELGQQAEFLGIMPSNEMLMRWFISDQTEMGRYRLKSHGEADFWQWMAGWSRMAQSPDDLGFDGSRFVLPALAITRHRATYGEVKPIEGSLFTLDTSATAIHDVKRQTAANRADKAAELVAADTCAWVVWCDTDYEADELAKRLPDAVEVRGSMTIERKEENLAAFASGDARVIITKPSVAGMGLNWQHCARMVFVGRSFSYEAWYQAVRRCWRFGQTRPVEAHIIVAEGEDQIGRVIDRKAADHATMKQSMALAMQNALSAKSDRLVAYDPKHKGRIPAWLRSVA